jgi:hypothetical protein
MNLFRGLDSLPTDLVASDALSFDDDLFDITEEEITRLSEMFPSYSSVIKVGVSHLTPLLQLILHTLTLTSTPLPLLHPLSPRRTK